MIILDTNVLSALMRTARDAIVSSWVDKQPAQSVWITAITVFEARFGMARLAPGRRRKAIERAEHMAMRIADTMWQAPGRRRNLRGSDCLDRRHVASAPR